MKKPYNFKLLPPRYWDLKPYDCFMRNPFSRFPVKAHFVFGFITWNTEGW